MEDRGSQAVAASLATSKRAAETERVDPGPGLWSHFEDLVPPELPPDVAVARLVALAQSLVIENRQLREALNLERARPLPDGGQAA
jgi:hypothetical protein